ncbi:hypothetical protein ABQU74_20785 [Xanthomonas sp. WHRI 10208]|uniref:hypothetical protein n=1 Tax=Xanthomonas TaxID=338 RepID=UPI002B2222F2|nr:hypothetical protein [Xanthomonas nasturtii]
MEGIARLSCGHLGNDRGSAGIAGGVFSVVSLDVLRVDVSVVASAPVLLAFGATVHLQRVVVRVASATLLASALYGLLYMLMGTLLLWPGVLCAPLLILFLEWRRARRLRPASNDVQPA